MQEQVLLNYILASLGPSPQEQLIAELIHTNLELQRELEGKTTKKDLQRDKELASLGNQKFALEASIEDLFNQVKARDYEGMTRHMPAGSTVAQLSSYLISILKNAELLSLKNTRLLQFKDKIDSITCSDSNDGNKVSLIIDEATILRRYLRSLE
jgi:hypothetical protein